MNSPRPAFDFARRLLAILSLLMVCTARADLADGLVSYWPLDSVDGDISGDVAFTNHLAVVGGPATAPGKFGSAVTLNGSSMYLTNLHATDRTDTGLPIYNAGMYTVAMWVKGPAQVGRYLFTEGNTASGNPLFVLQTGSANNTNKLDIIIRTDANTTLINHLVSSNAVFDDTWHHIAWVDSNGEVRLYIDGQLDPANFNYGRGGAFTFSSTVIGTLVRTGIATAMFNGMVDDVAVWERALSQAEVQSLMTNSIPTPVTQRRPVLYAQPQSVNRGMGDWNIFSVEAYAVRPNATFSYQWYRDGEPIPGATGRTYQTPHLTTADSGQVFYVAVSNGLGQTNSASATLTVSADPPANVRSNLVSYWPLDAIEQVDTNLFSPDLYSHTDFVLQNFLDTFDYVPGQFGNALSFDFTARYAYRTNGTAISANSNYSVSMWVFTPDFLGQSDRRVFSEGSPTNNQPLFTLGTHPTAGNGSLSVYLRTDTGRALLPGRLSTRSVFDALWHHIVWTDNGGQGKLYIDGTLDETDFSYSRGPLTVSQTAIGAVLRGITSGNFFYGYIDEVATWNRVLSWTEIQQIKDQGVPEPLGAIAPTIAVEPADRTNNVFFGDTVSFNVTANGTFPLSYQWRKDDAPIDGAANPSALTDQLVLTNIGTADIAAYSVVVSNSAGSVTSRAARLEAQPYTPVASGEVLALDLGLAANPNVFPGFTEFNLSKNGTNFNGVGFTLSSIGNASLAERYRTSTPPFVTNAPPQLTQAAIYNDFTFAGSATEGAGMRILIERLVPNAPYGVTIWSFDPVSTGSRVSDWTETASGAPVVITNAYTFEATNLPSADFQYTFGGVLRASPAGKLQIEGRRNALSVNAAGNNDNGVFLNAIRLVAQPAGTRINRVEISGGTVRLYVQGDYPGQPISVQESPSLAPGSWTAAPAIPAATNGPQVIFEISASGEQKFYRGVSQQTW